MSSEHDNDNDSARRGGTTSLLSGAARGAALVGGLGLLLIVLQLGVSRGCWG
jgi:hypothetical protein